MTISGGERVTSRARRKRSSVAGSRCAPRGSAVPVGGSDKSGFPKSRLLRDRDPSDPVWRAVELVQRGRMILDVSAADLEAAESTHGPFHPTAWHFRNAWHEALRSWDRLRAELGGATLDAALVEPPLTVLALGPRAKLFAPDRRGRWPLPAADPALVLLIPITGRTYRVQRISGTDLAPVLYRLTRLSTAPHEDGPYYACRLLDGATQCDCAEWIYKVVGNEHERGACKHIEALGALGWF